MVWFGLAFLSSSFEGDCICYSGDMGVSVPLVFQGLELHFLDRCGDLFEDFVRIRLLLCWRTKVSNSQLISIGKGKVTTLLAFLAF